MKFSKPSEAIDAGYGCLQYSINNTARLFKTNSGEYVTPLEFEGMFYAYLDRDLLPFAKTEDIIKAAI